MIQMVATMTLVGARTFASAGDALAYAAECALVTQESLELRKGRSIGERTRAYSIALDLVVAVRDHGNWSDIAYRESRYPRLSRALAVGSVNG